MASVSQNKMPWRVPGYILTGFLAIAIGIFLSPVNHYLHSLILLACAVGLYFYIVIAVAQWNWLDIRAVFTGVWLATIGLAALRLTEYQEVWQNKTWLLSALGYAMFQTGANLGIATGNKHWSGIMEKAKGLKFGRISFRLHHDRLFWICVGATLIGLTCFCINVAIRGYIPCFVDDPKAYNTFYTKFHVFAVAACGVSGLCYYCIKMEPLSKVKKAILWLCILYLVFLFPTMVVSRGVFVVVALSLTAAVFYLNKRKLMVLISCIAIIFGVYLFVTTLRDYTDYQLNVFFEPKEITISSPVTSPTETVVPTENGGTAQATEAPVEQTTPPESPSTEAKTFTLSPKMAFLYSYLTVSHDNFNEAVKYAKTYTWGLRQFEPFNVILRQQWITDILEEAEYYQVNPYLTTTNMMGVFYYDFHEAGVVLCVLLWAFVFGLMQSCFLNTKGLFSMMTLGNALSPVTLSFFASWVDRFELWMFWGVILIVACIACIQIDKKKCNG